MGIVAEEGASGGRYRLVVDGHEAQMTYSRASPALIIIDHTHVPDALRGRGIGETLALHAVEEARRGGWRIVPLCPFFRVQTRRHPEWADVVQG